MPHWIPAFAGMTAGWISAFTGMTKGWVPAFAIQAGVLAFAVIPAQAGIQGGLMQAFWLAFARVRPTRTRGWVVMPVLREWLVYPTGFRLSPE